MEEPEEYKKTETKEYKESEFNLDERIYHDVLSHTFEKLTNIEDIQSLLSTNRNFRDMGKSFIKYLTLDKDIVRLFNIKLIKDFKNLKEIDYNIVFKVFSLEDIDLISENIKDLDINVLFEESDRDLRKKIFKLISFFYNSKGYLKILIRKSSEDYTYVLFKNNVIFLPEGSFGIFKYLFRRLGSKNVKILFFLSGYKSENIPNIDKLIEKYYNIFFILPSKLYDVYYLSPTILKYIRDSDIIIDGKRLNDEIYMLSSGYFSYLFLENNLEVLIILSLYVRGFIDNVYEAYNKKTNIVLDEELYKITTKYIERKIPKKSSKLPRNFIRNIINILEYHYQSNVLLMKLSLNEILKMDFPTIINTELIEKDNNFFDLLKYKLKNNKKIIIKQNNSNKKK